MNDPRPTKKIERDGKEIEVVLCARCCGWTERGDRCEKCHQRQDWEKK